MKPTGNPTSTLAADPADLATLVEPQPGSVVSRVLERTGGGTVTLFAFAPGQGLTEHTSPHTALVLLVDGQLRITLRHGEDRGDETHVLEAGDILRIPPNVPHELHGGEAYRMLLTLLRD